MTSFQYLLQRGRSPGYFSADENPKLSGGTKGEWRLNTCGTGWVLFTPHGCVASTSANETFLQSELRVLGNAKVVDFKIGIPNNIITVEFENNLSLTHYSKSKG